MPALTLPPFITYERNDFHIGGNPGGVRQAPDQWQFFIDALASTASTMRTADNADFTGSEAEVFHKRLYDFAPTRLEAMRRSHENVAEHIYMYSTRLSEQLDQMHLLTTKARGDHATVNICAAAVDQAELQLNAVLFTGNAAAITAAKLHLKHCETAHQGALHIWENDLKAAAEIKHVLGTHVTALASAIKGEQTNFLDAGIPGLGVSSHDVHLHIGRLAELGTLLQGLSTDLEGSAESVIRVSSVDDVHGHRIEQAVSDYINAWSEPKTTIIDFILRLGNSALIIAELFSTVDDNEATKLSKLEGEIRNMSFNPFGKEDKAYIPGHSYVDEKTARLDAVLVTRQPGYGPPTPESLTAQKRNKLREDLASKGTYTYDKNREQLLRDLGLDPNNGVAEKILSKNQNLHGTDYVSGQGDWLSREADGGLDAYPLGTPPGVTKLNRVDGSQIVQQGGRTTTYYPIAPKGTQVGDQMLSRTYDKATGTTTMEILRADGTVVQKSAEGFPLYNPLEDGTVPAHAELGNPNNQIAEIHHIDHNDSATTLIHRPHEGIIEVVDPNHPKMIIDGNNRHVLQYGEETMPKSASNEPLAYSIKTNEVFFEKNPGQGINDIATDFKNQTDPGPTIFGATGQSAQTGMDQYKTPAIDIPGWQVTARTASYLGPMGDGITLTQGVTESILTHDVKPVVAAGGDIAGSQLGTAYGAAKGGTLFYQLGRFFGPEVAAPAGVIGAIIGGGTGAYLGGKAGREAAGMVIDKAQG